MKKLDSKEELSMLKDLLYVSLISADNEEYQEDVKQEILSRHKKASADFEDPTDSEIDWEYVFEPLGKDAEKYIKLMKAHHI